MKIKVRIPATTANFGPGFDCVGSALKLYNEIEVNLLANKKEKLKIEIEGEGKQELPENEKNIIWQAMQKVFDILKYKSPALYIKMTNRIPLGRGLGSSASGIIGGLVIANELCGNKLSEKEILNIATELEGHPDNVVPAMVGGFCVVVKTKDTIEYIKFDIPKNLNVILCIPEFNISTEYARKILPLFVSHSDAVFNCSRVAFLVSAIIKKNFDLLKLAMEDKLHQNYRKKLIPGMEDVFYSALNSGCFGVALSGSGPTIVAVADRVKSKKIGKEMVKAFAKNKIKSKYIICDFDNMGVKIAK